MDHLSGPLLGLSNASDSFATEASLTPHTCASDCMVATLATQREQEWVRASQGPDVGHMGKRNSQELF